MKKNLSGFTVVIEKDKATGYFVGEVVELLGRFAQGKTVEEVLKRLEELIPFFVEEVAKVNDINFQEISLCEC